MSPHNLGRQIAPAYASITSAIEAEQVAAYSQPSEFDTNATTTLYREQPVLYAGEVYQHGVAAPEQLHCKSLLAISELLVPFFFLRVQSRFNISRPLKSVSFILFP